MLVPTAPLSAQRDRQRMYITLGTEVFSDRDVVGIFDMDATTVSKRTRDFLRAAQEGGRVADTSFELPKAFVVAAKRGARGREGERVYITQYNTATIGKRIQADE